MASRVSARRLVSEHHIQRVAQTGLRTANIVTNRMHNPVAAGFSWQEQLCSLRSCHVYFYSISFTMFIVYTLISALGGGLERL